MLVLVLVLLQQQHPAWCCRSLVRRRWPRRWRYKVIHSCFSGGDGDCWRRQLLLSGSCGERGGVVRGLWDSLLALCLCCLKRV